MWTDTRRWRDSRAAVLHITELRFVGKLMHVQPKQYRTMGTHLVGRVSTEPDKEDSTVTCLGEGFESMPSQHGLQESGLQPSAEPALSPLYLNRSRRLPFPPCSRLDSTDSHLSQSAVAFSSYLSPHLFYHPLLY